MFLSLVVCGRVNLVDDQETGFRGRCVLSVSEQDMLLAPLSKCLLGHDTCLTTMFKSVACVQRMLDMSASDRWVFAGVMEFKSLLAD